MMLTPHLSQLTKLAMSFALAAGMTAAAGFMPAGEARADTYPMQPVQLIVPYRAGGGTDTMARVFATAMSEELGQPVVVVNHAGGGGALGGSVLANAEPDGYTIMLGGDDIPSYIPHVSEVDFSFDSFQALGAVAEYQNAFIARAGAPYTTFEEFVAYAQDNPGVRLGHVGGITQPFIETLVEQSGIDARVVTTAGGAEIVQFLLAGQIDAGYSGGIHNQNPEQWEVLGSFNEERLASAPDRPTFAEAGFGMSMPAKIVLVAPAGTPADVVATLEGAIAAASADDDFVTLVQDRLSAPVSLMSSADTAAYLSGLNESMAELAQ